MPGFVSDRRCRGDGAAATVMGRRRAGGQPGRLTLKPGEPVRGWFRGGTRSGAGLARLPAGRACLKSSSRKFPEPGPAIRMPGQSPHTSPVVCAGRTRCISMSCAGRGFTVRSDRRSPFCSRCAWLASWWASRGNVAGDGRIEGYVPAVCAVTRDNGMTADFSAFGMPVDMAFLLRSDRRRRV
jgi:hypothetical protein